MAVEVTELPSYDPSAIGWEPIEPWWDRGYWAWVRDYWRREARVPFKRNKRSFGR